MAGFGGNLANSLRGRFSLDILERYRIQAPG
jgi:hypothetical protein